MVLDTLLAPITALFELGGSVVVILVVLSVVALAVIILKLWQFAAEGVGRRRSAKRAVDAWIHGQDHVALQAAEAGRGPVAGTVAAALRGLIFGGLDRQIVEEDAARIAQERLHSLSRGLRLLEAVAQIAPLLGLFGTVLGMIQAFQAMQEAGANIDPSQLAGGIWVALLTTAVGLAIAMPVSLITTWFDGRIDNERIAIETLLTAVFTRRATDRRPELPAAVAKRGMAVGAVPGE
ncbi:MotA/TolQ/ExbB proton channel family protein [Consotaella aegiceratis]|uniref:MotA/TolQ/ExbB proton channel family protein n=1 Tax=Consotaella aegiceratis TaxID=3097961 RepID=UPI002F428A95